MRNRSYMLTTRQVRERSKSVTRRTGWKHAKAGDLTQPVVKGQGLKKGERVERIGGPTRDVDVRFEPLRRMVDEPEYGRAECIKEGFPELSPVAFVAMFCEHNRCAPETVVTRIEFEYL